MTGRPPPPPRQRIAARLLLAACTLAVGLGLGAAIAVKGVLDVHNPDLRVRSPGQRETRLGSGVYELFVLRNDPGGGAPISESRPSCSFIDVRSGMAAPGVMTDAGFAAARVQRGGRHRVTCTSAIPVTIDVDRRDKGALVYLAAIARGLVPAVALTALAAVLAARALLAAQRLRTAGGR